LAAANGAFSGTPEKIHDGLDSTLWTATSVVGNKFTFNSTNVIINGAASIEIANPNVGDIMQFDNGSDFPLSAHAAITFNIQITSDWTPGDSISIYGYDTGGGVQVGTKVLIEGLIDITDLVVTQVVVIPLADMGLATATVDAFRIEIETRGGPKSPTFYMDDLQIEELGENIDFTLLPNPGKKTKIHRFAVNVSGPLDMHLLRNPSTDGFSVSNLDINKILNIGPLTNGILTTRTRKGVDGFLGNFRKLGDNLKFAANLKNEISNGVLSCISLTLDFTDPPIMDNAFSDKIVVTVRDDLTALTDCQVIIFGSEVDSDPC